jgi:Mg2+ and Co2+ transporter CorA
VAKLIAGRVPQVCSDNREYFRDVYDHLARMNASLDSLRDTIAIAMQVNLSMVTIEEPRSPSAWPPRPASSRSRPRSPGSGA